MVQDIVWSKVQIGSNTLGLVKVYFYDLDISINEEGLKRPVGLCKTGCKSALTYRLLRIYPDVLAVKDLA